MTTKRYLWKEANNLHKKFTDEMYREFGHDIHPGYARIKIRPLLISGAAMIGNPKKKGVNRIYLPDNRISREKRQDDELDFLVTCAHESAHLLDRKLIQWTWEYHPKLPLSKRLFRRSS